ncbi:hypothetical protein HYPSUDRAFT_194398 [Hypholoma sublateritium FD-334 SS-4]|uniref:HECT-type E3 ubiquitin transferase n=1 Tax=Hypholoma sublateritium (strain FD-334 SS-4) TaxID=945553 RepID=A0A0D2LWT1_HYPSF|nr:hypothetical protein HYPSUDRAFT_194398 [Hypholoma sublateritium FD-334 SS-4]
MIPTFGDEWKRKINLGGASSSATPASILNRVQAERAARAEHKQRTESAIRIQAWYRGVVDARAAKEKMRRLFQKDILGLTGLRCLVLIGTDVDALAMWSDAVVKGGPDQVFVPARSIHRTSWLVLIRQVAVLLLKAVAETPESPNSTLYLSVLNTLSSANAATAALAADGPPACGLITEYLVDHEFYRLLAQAIERIPIEAKSSPNLPGIISLITNPLSTFPHDSSRYAQSLTQIFVSILTLPLLPNRLPLAHLPKFTSALPLTTLDVIAPQVPAILASTSVSDKIHLASNLYMFTSPQYSRLSAPAFETYLSISAYLFHSFPSAIFKPKPTKSRAAPKAGERLADWENEDTDADSTHETRVSVVPSFFQPMPPPPPIIDPKTLKRLEKIITQQHLSALISTTQFKSALFLPLVSYLFSLGRAWPEKDQEKIFNVVLANIGGGLVRELYRNVVRRSVLGKEENSGSVMDPANASQWPPLLFLADLYSQALLTMGDDEFFGTAGQGSASASRAIRNPLTLDELISFSRQLLNIAFTLFWRDDVTTGVLQTQPQATQVVGPPGVRCSWEVVREKVTRCLVGIHARDSRKPFVPVDHWLVTSQLDMNSFVEAAVLEDQQISSPTQPLARALSKRQIAAMSPRLGILNNIPFAIPFEVRVAIFRNFVAHDMAARGHGHGFRRGFNPFAPHGGKARVAVRRGMVAQDGFDRLGEVDMKAPVEITFIDQFGQEEAGIDGGGVFKEFFTSLCKEVFDTDRGLWLANKKNELYPNPHAYATEPHSLNWYRFIGRILGKAMYEGILVDVGFAGFFLAKWLGKQSFLDDLSSLDPDLYNGLIFLKHYDGNLEDLALNFTMAIEEFGLTKTVDLIPNGSNISVTKENRLTYIYLVSHYRLSKQIKQQSEAFFEGLSEMIDQKWLRMFNQQEVQILIGGVNSPIDLDDLRQNTNYGGLYDDAHPVIVTFWNVVNSLDQEQRRALLRFVTSCSRPPLLGFKELIPLFSIRDAGVDQNRLPTSSTCVNLLKLPRYETERTLREKLVQAINSNAGFDLS